MDCGYQYKPIRAKSREHNPIFTRDGCFWDGMPFPRNCSGPDGCETRLRLPLGGGVSTVPCQFSFSSSLSEDGEYFLKVLIPSYAAGSIIGKGGQTIVQLQKETGATIKLSKSKDFYPGESELTSLQQRYPVREN
ncbi:UNVERIFIED_CONTAM: hypothetical protein K2H54_034829 [Gekko kuhli]